MSIPWPPTQGWKTQLPRLLHVRVEFSSTHFWPAARTWKCGMLRKKRIGSIDLPCEVFKVGYLGHGITGELCNRTSNRNMLCLRKNSDILGLLMLEFLGCEFVHAETFHRFSIVSGAVWWGFCGFLWPNATFWVCKMHFCISERFHWGYSMSYLRILR